MEVKKMILCVAEITFGVRYQYPLVEELCRDYITSTQTPSFWLSASENEMTRMKEKNIGHMSDSLAESSVILEKFAEAILSYGAFVFHAALIEYEGVGYAFAARSGVGKSTHIKLWKEVFGESVRIINGDKPIIRFENGKIYAYGCPWCGKERFGINDRCVLNKLCFIERAEENAIHQIGKQEALDRMLPQILFYQDGKKTLAVLDMASALLEKTELYLLVCTPTQEAAKIAYLGMNVMKGNEL